MQTGDDVDFAVLKTAVEAVVEELGKIDHRLDRLEKLNEDSVVIRRLFVALSTAAGTVQQFLQERATGT